MRLARLIGIVAICGAYELSLWGETALSRIGGGIPLIPPVTVVAAIVILSLVSFSAGLWFALIAGFTIDSIALPPFGATVILFASLACMMALARILMAERRSYTMSVVWGAGFCVVAWAIVPLARAAAGLLNG